MPGKDLGLPVKRRVVAILADQHLGDEPRRGQALGDRTVGSRRLMDRAAGAAAVLGAADAQDAKLRRNPRCARSGGVSRGVAWSAASRVVAMWHESMGYHL